MFEHLIRRELREYGIVVILVDSALKVSSFGRLGGLFKFHSDTGMQPELRFMLDRIAKDACTEKPESGLEHYRTAAILLLFLNKHSSRN